MKILLISSSGGHLTQLVQIKKIISMYKLVVISSNRADGRSIADINVKDPGINKINHIKLFFKYLRVLFKENPNVIIATGAGLALPMIIAGKLFKKKIVFIESFCRPFELSKTGQIVYKYNLANLFLVQWPELVKKYPKAKYWGRVI